jgi:hypothetical protein
MDQNVEFLTKRTIRVKYIKMLEARNKKEIKRINEAFNQMMER